MGIECVCVTLILHVQQSEPAVHILSAVPTVLCAKQRVSFE